MKTITSTLFILLVALNTNAADFANFAKLFEKTDLPYRVPEGAYMDYGSEEFEAPFSGKSIDGEMAVEFLGAFENGNTQYEAVAKIEQTNYIAFVVFETTVRMNDGSVSGQFVLYTLDKAGTYISSEIIGLVNFRSSGNYFETNTLSAVIKNSEWLGDENKL